MAMFPLIEAIEIVIEIMFPLTVVTENVAEDVKEKETNVAENVTEGKENVTEDVTVFPLTVVTEDVADAAAVHADVIVEIMKTDQLL